MTDQHTAPSPHPDRTGRRLRAGGALLCTAVLLGALVGSSAPAAVVIKDEHFISAQTPGVLDIEGGECFDDPVHLPEAGGTVVRYRPCALTADNQTYGFVHADDDADWAPAALGEFAWGACRDLFTRTWPDGQDRDLRFYPVLPTEETWAAGDRDVMCVAYRPGGRLSGSMLPRW
ncbi:hypothetical protein ACIBO1_21030 [Micromonospora sp. NPDC049903]|uniref:hypothetical protein n=1 Tax=Micromonospora sp. NPDC049903 TaxID=3364276 RepID=UPI00378C1925